MKKAIVGKKIGMTQVFTEDGRLVPVTVIEAGPCTVVQTKTVESDGYAAVQIGGFAEGKVSGEGVSAGMVKLSADGSGGVKLDAGAGVEYLVAAVDSAAGTAVVLL